jgi:protein phosphatase
MVFYAAISMKIRYSADTDVGLKREINQDYFGLGDSSSSETKGYLMVVCDGMGGHSSGEVASRLGVDTIIKYFYESDEEDRTAPLEYAFFEANRCIYEEGDGSMGTTGVAALFYKGMIYIANVGDSRAYLIREGHIDQISRDHSLVAEQVAAGLLTAEQARQSNYRNMITRALGYRAEVQVDIFSLAMHTGDIVVLSSDGLHGLVEDDEINQVVSTMPSDQAIPHLIEMANDRGGVDNITVAIAVVEENGTVKGADTDDAAGPEAETKTRLISSHSTPATTQRITPFAAPNTSRLPETSAESESSPDPPQPATMSGWNKGIIGIVVVVLLGVVGYFALPSMGSQQTSSVVPTSDATATIPIINTRTLTSTPTLTATTQSLPTRTSTSTNPDRSQDADNANQTDGVDDVSMPAQSDTNSSETITPTLTTTPPLTNTSIVTTVTTTPPLTGTAISPDETQDQMDTIPTNNILVPSPTFIITEEPPIMPTVGQDNPPVSPLLPTDIPNPSLP